MSAVSSNKYIFIYCTEHVQDYFVQHLALAAGVERLWQIGIKAVSSYNVVLSVNIGPVFIV